MTTIKISLKSAVVTGPVVAAVVAVVVTGPNCLEVEDNLIFKILISRCLDIGMLKIEI